ncbi:MAG: antitoxin Xre/MbcA/ParS toxin-binding domain-containing protein [Gemmatimonadaceae bacterium]
MDVIFSPNGLTSGGAMDYPSIDAVVAALGGKRVLREDVHTMGELSRLVMAGLPFLALRRVSALYPVDQRARVEQVVVPRTTMLRREQSGVLSTEESERLERLARLTALAEHVLESLAEAREFLTTPHSLLEGEAPLDLAATDLGARRVEGVLWRMEYSLPV